MPNLRRLARLVWLPPAILLLGASGAAAQMLTVNPISVGDRSYNTVGDEFINRADCEENAVILFELDNVPTNVAFIDLWEGQRCNETAPRSMEGDCRWLDSVEIESSQGQRVELETQDLAEEGCERDDVLTLWLLAVNDDNSVEEPAASASFPIELDFTPPRAPSDVQGGSGERQIPVSWDLPSGGDLESFVVYIDNDPQGGSVEPDADGGAAGPEECASSLIFGGMDPLDVPDEIDVKRVDSGSATTTDIRPDDVVGMVAAVAVTAIDEAGNESNLSNIACLRVVPTEGFWERYEESGGDVQGGCPCTALGPVHAHQGWPVALALLSLWRRHRRKS